MALPKIRPAALYYGSKKVADITEGTYKLSSGDQIEIGAEGVIGFTDGVTTASIDATMVVPIQGLSVPVLTDMLAKKYVVIRVFEDGRSHNLDMRVMNIEYSWNSAKGENRCRASFEGGAPQLS